VWTAAVAPLLARNELTESVPPAFTSCKSLHYQ
jgi:hypothetical protein